MGQEKRGDGRREVLPAGSLRWDRLVRSSLASSMVGFISGGSDGWLLLLARASAVTSTTLDYTCAGAV